MEGNSADPDGAARMNVEITKNHGHNTYTAVVNGLTFGPFYTTGNPERRAVRLYEISLEDDTPEVGGSAGSRMMLTTGSGA